MSKSRAKAVKKPIVANPVVNNTPSATNPPKNSPGLNQLISRREKLLADAEILLKAIEFLKSDF